MLSLWTVLMSLAIFVYLFISSVNFFIYVLKIYAFERESAQAYMRVREGGAEGENLEQVPGEQEPDVIPGPQDHDLS